MYEYEATNLTALELDPYCPLEGVIYQHYSEDQQKLL